MNKKNVYIRAEVDIVDLGASALMAGSLESEGNTGSLGGFGNNSDAPVGGGGHGLNGAKQGWFEENEE